MKDKLEQNVIDRINSTYNEREALLLSALLDRIKSQQSELTKANYQMDRMAENAILRNEELAKQDAELTKLRELRIKFLAMTFTGAHSRFLDAPLLTYGQEDIRELRDLARECYNPSTTLRDFWRDLSAWSQEAFGSDSERGPIGPLKHLRKEIDEVMDSPADIEEYADCQFLVFDAARRAGFTFKELLEECWRKLEINKCREWSKSGSDEPCEHVRS